MFLVMGITGKVGGAAAEHLLAQGKKVRALKANHVRSLDKFRRWLALSRFAGVTQLPGVII